MTQFEEWPQDNTEWIKALSGQLGAARQQHSHAALGNYLYVVGFNCLRMHQGHLPLLASFADEELATLAEEFVQDFLIRLTVNQYARLKTYRGEGSFQKWAAVGLKRVIDKDLKKKSWHERERLPDDDDWHEPLPPPSEVERLPVQLSLAHCLQTLSERERQVFLRRVDHEESAQAVADDLAITANAVNILLSRVKNKLRLCLELQGILNSQDL